MTSTIQKELIDSMGVIHFIGIGGIGMSGIAEILHNLGYKIQGSDNTSNQNTERLKNLGLKIFQGHDPKNIDGAGVVVISTAVKNTNPEVIEARSKHIPIVKRSEMLAELMRLKVSIAITGTHGKTTTTSLVAAIFEAANQKPTVINGGILNVQNTNAYLGEGKFLVAEADESDATFIKIPSTAGIITNIDPEHLDFYGSYDNLKAAFRTFIENLPFYGFAVVCIDNEEVRNLITSITDRKILTYSIDNKEADIYATNIRNTDKGYMYDIVTSAKLNKNTKDFLLPMSGIHNVQNSLAAIATAIQFNLEIDDIKKGLASFGGVKRRFTRVKEVEDVLFVDDYAHHPTEVKATLQTAREVAERRNGKVIAIFQPHRYTRVRDLFSEFSHAFEGADEIYIADIYSAGEDPIDGISSTVLVESIKQVTDNKVHFLHKFEQLADILAKIANRKDLVLFMGAGNITYWAYDMPDLYSQSLDKVNAS
jgi:UDP-N-acetylmuramate--alanine ligase